jgi:hypothetical protein
MSMRNELSAAQKALQKAPEDVVQAEANPINSIMETVEGLLPMVLPLLALL